MVSMRHKMKRVILATRFAKRRPKNLTTRCIQPRLLKKIGWTATNSFNSSASKSNGWIKEWRKSFLEELVLISLTRLSLSSDVTQVLAWSHQKESHRPLAVQEDQSIRCAPSMIRCRPWEGLFQATGMIWARKKAAAIWTQSARWSASCTLRTIRTLIAKSHKALLVIQATDQSASLSSFLKRTIKWTISNFKALKRISSRTEWTKR